MRIELGLGNLCCLLEVIVRELGIDYLVAVLRQVHRFDTTWDGPPAVEEEDFHGVILCGTVFQTGMRIGAWPGQPFCRMVSASSINSPIRKPMNNSRPGCTIRNSSF